MKVFSKLYRGSNLKDRNKEGVGLELYLVKVVVEQVGGRIWFEFEENKRTTFYVYIPLGGMKKSEAKKIQ